MDIYLLHFIFELFFDDDDEDEEKLPLIKIWNFVEETVPNFTDSQFQIHFRMTSSTFETLLGQLHFLPNAVTKLSGNPEINLEKQLLISLWYLSNIESFRGVADRFGISKSTAWSCLYKICTLLLEANIHYQIISFPNDEECTRISNQIKRRTTFPGVIGAVDGSHIPIVAPREESASYVNRKGFFSIILQATCNDKKEFIHCYVGEAGSVHDAAVYRRSCLPDIVNAMNIPDDGHLLGDSAYPLSTKLLVPFKDNGHLTAIQVNYNKVHSKARVVIETAFALLKGRFRRLKLCETKRVEVIPLLIMSACILHNVCLKREDMPNDIIIDAEISEERLMNDHLNLEVDMNQLEKRDNIANALYFELLQRQNV